MWTCDFDYQLPEELIAQTPASKRDHSRLLVLHRESNRLEDRHFYDVTEYLRAGDVLILNDSQVIPARLHGTNAKTGGEFEMLLLEELSANDWWAMLRPGKRAKVGTNIRLKDRMGNPASLTATVTATNPEGHRRLSFSGTPNLLDELAWLGEMPVPPYVTREDAGRSAEDVARYQTVYARAAGSVAAPTAGLHFTETLLEKIRAAGVEVGFVTLHVGLGTFAPVKVEAPAAHQMHSERYRVTEETAGIIRKAKAEGRRVIAVGTTSLRVLESVARQHEGGVCATAGSTELFVYPPYRFRVVDALLTNFHLPRTTLLMLVSAFTSPNQTDGREKILAAYGAAIGMRYRFFSYGDAMLIL